MTVQELILSLISGITDPATRIEVARTINYLKEVYLHGTAPEGEIRKALEEVCYTILKYREPTKNDKELKDDARRWAENFLREFRLASLFHMTTKNLMKELGRMGFG